MTHPIPPVPTHDTVGSWQPPEHAAEGSPPTAPPVWAPPPQGPEPGGYGYGYGYGGGAPPAWGPPSWGAWSPPPPPPVRHRGRLVAIVLAVLVTIAAAVGSGIALGTRSTSSRSSTSPSLAPLPTPPPQSSGSGSSGQLDASAVASRIDPAVVDITIRTAQGGAAGTGMILTPSGEVLTNNHVVEGATSVTLQVAGAGKQYPGTVIGVDPTDDVALVQMSGASNLPTVPLGNSSSVAVGDAILALGNALGRGGTPVATQGTVTALDQTVTASDGNGASTETLSGMIEVRAGIQPGDSGGPIADTSGHVVAMTTAGSARARRTGAVGFGIPINKALSIGQQILSGGGGNVQPGQRGILGVEIDTSATGTNGASVAQVQSGSPAAAAGITGGDVITGIDGTNVASAGELGKALQAHKPGDTVTVRWTDQSGQHHTAQLKLATGPPA